MGRPVSELPAPGAAEPLRRGQGEGPEQILNNSENTVEGVSLQWVGEPRVKSGEHFFGEAL